MGTHLIIPMAGDGVRMGEGFPVPKPYINVCGKPMFARVIENMPKVDTVQLVINKSHLHHLTAWDLWDEFVLEYKVYVESEVQLSPIPTKISRICKDLKDHVQDCSVLIAHCDQILDWDGEAFLKRARLSRCSSVIPVVPYSGEHQSKWGHVGYDMQTNSVRYVRPGEAYEHSGMLCGVYYFARVTDIVDLYEANEYGMNDKVEHMISDLVEIGAPVSCAHIKKCIHLGTEADFSKALVKFEEWGVG